MAGHDVVRSRQSYCAPFRRADVRSMWQGRYRQRYAEVSLLFSILTHSRRTAPRRQTLPAVPTPDAMACSERRAIRRDHGKGVECGRTIFRAEL